MHGLDLLIDYDSTIYAMREFCVYQLCTVLHSDAEGATGAPVTHWNT
jgi:hypothetical protein